MSMLTVNLNNVEEIIFRNKTLRNALPELRGYFDQWNLASQHPFLKAMGKQATIDLLNALNEKHTKILESHFGMSVTVDKLNNRAFTSFQWEIDKAEYELNQLNDMAQISAYRKGDQLYISLTK